MNTLLIILISLIVVVWVLLAFLGDKALKYLAKYEEDDYAKNLEDYLRNRHKKWRRDREQRMLNNPFAANQSQSIDDMRIIGIRKPIGKWTRLVTMNNLEYLNNFRLLLGSKLSDKMGFWQLKVRGQSFGEGKFKGKNR